MPVPNTDIPELLGFDTGVCLSNLDVLGERQSRLSESLLAMLSELADRLFCVRGNCDTEVDQMVLPFPILAETALLFVDGRTWFAAHGHRAGANPTAGDLPKLPSGSVVLTGHTHIPTLDRTPEGLILLNPGSTSIPKGGFDPSYALYEDGCLSVMSLDGRCILREDQL